MARCIPQTLAYCRSLVARCHPNQAQAFGLLQNYNGPLHYTLGALVQVWLASGVERGPNEAERASHTFFCCRKFLGKNIFWGKKFFRGKKIFGEKKVFFGEKKVLGRKKFFLGQKKFWGEKSFFWGKKSFFWGQKSCM